MLFLSYLKSNEFHLDSYFSLLILFFNDRFNDFLWFFSTKNEFDSVSFMADFNIPFWLSFYLISSSINWEQSTWLNCLVTKVNWFSNHQNLLFEFLFVFLSHIPSWPVMDFVIIHIVLIWRFIEIRRYHVDFFVSWKKVMG